MIQDFGCPSEMASYLEKSTSSPRICTAGANSCPIGYFCQFSSQLSTFICCGIRASKCHYPVYRCNMINSGCPNDHVAFIGISGEPQLCVIGQTTCPTGYSCQKGLNEHQVCCTSGANKSTLCKFIASSSLWILY